MNSVSVAACVGSGLLVIVAALPCVGTSRRVTTLAALAASLGAGAALVAWALSASDYLPKNQVSRVVRHGVQQIQKWNEHPKGNLLVIEGGSYTSRGVNPEVLRAELARLGHDVQVVQMGIGAANHFERHRVFSDVLERVRPTPAKKKLGQRVVVLSEVHRGYDQSPFKQLDENQDTDRCYHYLTPVNAWHGLRAYIQSALEAKDYDLTKHAAFTWTVTRHVLVNAFNVGAALRNAPLSRSKPSSGFLGGGVNKGYHFAGMAEALAGLEDPSESTAKIPVSDWLFDTREARLKQLWKRHFDQWVYFSIPSTGPDGAPWTQQFCRVAHEPCIPIDDPALLKSLDAKRLWRDSGHLTTAGSKVYTRWLARKLAAENVLLKRPSKVDGASAESEPGGAKSSKSKKPKRKKSATKAQHSPSE